MDYDDTFSLVVNPTTIRLLLSLVVSCGWVIRQIDIQNAFLRGFLDVAVYMKQPPSLRIPLVQSIFAGLISHGVALNKLLVHGSLA